MFSLASNRGMLDVTDQEHVVSVYHSINESKVITEDQQAHLAKAFICVFQFGSQDFEVEVYFYLSDQQSSVRFTHSQGRIERKFLPEIESQALEFVESLGFMMDSLRISGVPSKVKNSKLAALPIFSTVNVQLTPIPKTEAEVMSDEFSLSGLEANFERSAEEVFVKEEDSFGALFDSSDPSISIDFSKSIQNSESRDIPIEAKDDEYVQNRVQKTVTPELFSFLLLF